MIRKVSAEDIAIRGNGTGLEYMCPTRHFVYIFFNPVFQVSTAKNEINLFNNHVLIVAPVTFAPAGAMTPSAEFLLKSGLQHLSQLGKILALLQYLLVLVYLIFKLLWLEIMDMGSSVVTFFMLFIGTSHGNKFNITHLVT